MPRLRCLHDWSLESDWTGDPNVINGTYSWNVFRCRKCGGEREASHKEARDHEAYLAEQEADFYRDDR